MVKKLPILKTREEAIKIYLIQLWKAEKVQTLSLMLFMLIFEAVDGAKFVFCENLKGGRGVYQNTPPCISSKHSVESSDFVYFVQKMI